MKAKKYIKLKPGDCLVSDNGLGQYKVIEALEECSDDHFTFITLDCDDIDAIGIIMYGIPGEVPETLGYKRASKEKLADFEVNIEFTL